MQWLNSTKKATAQMTNEQEIREAALAHAVASQTSDKVNDSVKPSAVRLTNRILATAYRYERFITDGESALEEKEIS